MKLFITILAIILNVNGCNDSNINQDAISIEYSATSRGSYKHIIVNKKQIAFQKSRSSKTLIKPCSEENWYTIYDILKTIDISNIPNLKAPSDKRMFDAAAIAKLKITYQDSIYQSQPFDHGNPPEEIDQLVKEILSLTENIE
ncbi:hypothetical protein RBH94_04645 [Aestuariibaculum sp. YM273]|uniref:hypothetical protein n=1 Tax=Aestuariibaculum sp. YM273 TaxID=3070659 RepID=UPI0027DB2D7D|nr:hypothetical protein [Aestuariibaculum sp. YM273]WMI66451.1 hypothetical protein RBH94_04645 [Aestuariibaculum sp. YM273]